MFSCSSSLSYGDNSGPRSSSPGSGRHSPRVVQRRQASLGLLDVSKLRQGRSTSTSFNPVRSVSPWVEGRMTAVNEPKLGWWGSTSISTFRKKCIEQHLHRANNLGVKVLCLNAKLFSRNSPRHSDQKKNLPKCARIHTHLHLSLLKFPFCIFNFITKVLIWTKLPLFLWKTTHTNFLTSPWILFVEQRFWSHGKRVFHSLWGQPF